MRFLFPSDYFNPKKADAAYLEQVASMEDAGFVTSVVSLELLASGSSKIIPIPYPGSKVVYRGWMLSPSDYELLVSLVESTGASVLTSKVEYLATHYLPNWYPLIADLTPETKFYSINDDLESELNKLGWNKLFIKDYVKSLKTSVGSIIDKPSEIATVISEMQKFRGSIEGGICVRRIEDFVPETEKRYFVVSGKPFAALQDEEVPDIVEECAKRIGSQFFSVDVIERRDGTKRIVEIGDGQVSDIVGWTAERFAQLWV
ncbi:ATP-grasp domain-containing protein [Nostoc sp. KVJ3]|uniref:ATP-grasp domain-containing protein n=1 Tax=Nostoc sp. KVJ3 TaxID=457945 RepID=UPI002237BC1A|nr:ATP-grasp domain-containing protein [Nostoc sp. KVJ3]MCW5315706.1 ATP-grasp domain-containing protein [Nostoc sp. KVJ3]